MNFETQNTDILIIGLGLAGITAAITAAEKGKKGPGKEAWGGNLRGR